MTLSTEFPPFDPARSGGKYPLLDRESGIYVLPTISMAEDVATADRIQRLNEATLTVGWQKALADVWGGEADYVTNEDRLGFLPMLPLDKDHALLEIGASLGQVAIPLAHRVATVDGLEVVRGQAVFSAERARQLNVANIRITAGGQDCLLPYADAGFDGVVLNLVLEWCGDRATDGHEAMQRRLLGEIFRVLKPGGFLFLQTKNRYGLRLLLGGRDEHMFGMRWGSALPRWLGWIASGGRRPAGRLHSFPHLAAMLRGAGYSRIDGYWAVPEMRKPATLVPLAPDALRRWRRTTDGPQGASRSTRLLMRLLPDRLVKYVTPGLTFLAYR